jgi:hypothetical protein
MNHSESSGLEVVECFSDATIYSRATWPVRSEQKQRLDRIWQQQDFRIYPSRSRGSCRSAPSRSIRFSVSDAPRRASREGSKR